MVFDNSIAISIGGWSNIQAGFHHMFHKLLFRITQPQLSVRIKSCHFQSLPPGSQLLD